MKSLLYAAAAALALAGQASPAFASQTGPTISLVPLTPANVAVVTSGCNAAAGINGTPYFEMPQIAEDMGISGTAAVKIDLASSGDLRSASLFSSSGNNWLDDAALRSARMTKYIPETANCRHVAGSYLLDVAF